MTTLEQANKMMKQTPQLKGEAKLRAELAQAWKDIETLPFIEIAIRNPQVAEHGKHWSDRAIKAEAEVEALRTALSHAKTETVTATEGVAITSESATDQLAEHYTKLNQHCAMLENKLAAMEARMEQQDYWQEEARRYAGNADYWRGRCKAQENGRRWADYGEKP